MTRIVRLSPPATLRDDLVTDVRAGLATAPKSLPPKYFYDPRGSALFEQITTLPEYYLTRAETEILQAHAAEVVDLARPGEIVELGSGSSRKTRILLDAMGAAGTGRRYTAIDVSEAALREALAGLAASYPWLDAVGVVGDFTRDLPAVERTGRRLVTFLGSTIGNFEAADRAVFLKGLAGALGDGDTVLVGTDLVKDPATLEAAYDDAAGVTAAFNRNVLAVVNRELDGDIPLDAFEHVARYDTERQCVDMFLRATRRVVARLPAADLAVEFAAGEELHTEVSAKFTPDRVEQELGEAGLDLVRWFVDAEQRFGVALAVAGR